MKNLRQLKWLFHFGCRHWVSWPANLKSNINCAISQQIPLAYRIAIHELAKNDAACHVSRPPEPTTRYGGH